MADWRICTYFSLLLNLKIFVAIATYIKYSKYNTKTRSRDYANFFMQLEI
jgi:hypothetical protein